MNEREALCNVQITRHMYMGTPHAREVVNGKLLFVTEDQILIQNCLFTHRYKSLNGTYSVPSFNTNWSAKIAKVHYTIK